MCLLDMTYVCEPKEAISSMFFQYGAWEPNINCSALNTNVWTLILWQNGIEAASNQQYLSDEIRILCLQSVIILAHLLSLIISKTKKLGSVFFITIKGHLCCANIVTQSEILPSSPVSSLPVSSEPTLCSWIKCNVWASKIQEVWYSLNVGHSVVLYVYN